MVFTRPSTPLAVPASSPPLILPLYQGDCEQVLATLPENSFDAVVTDPPYHLTSGGKGGFMGKKWDGGDIAFRPELWAQVLRVMKPGAHLISFAATRNYHRMATAVEDAGFEIRDMVSWITAQGMPHSHDEGDGRGTGLKPAVEPCVLARKPCSEATVAANLLRWGTGALNIEVCRVGGEQRINAAASTSSMGRKTRAEQGHRPDDGVGPGAAAKQVVGRFPANAVHDGSDEVLAYFPDAPGQLADASATAPSARTGAIYGKMNRGGPAAARVKRLEGDKSAARFYFCAKATKADRCESKHTTVKPVALIRYLCRLVTPPGGRVLDPFAGSGTTYEAAVLEGVVPTLIEREAEYIIDIQRRMERCAAVICG